MSVHILGQRRDLGTEVGRLMGRAAIAMELDVRHVQAVPIESLHALQCRRPVTWHAQVQAVKMDRMWKGKRVHRTRQRGRDLSRADIEMTNTIIPVCQFLLSLFPLLNSAGIDNL